MIESVLNGPSYFLSKDTFEFEEEQIKQGIQAGRTRGETSSILTTLQKITSSRGSELTNASKFERLRQLAAAREQGLALCVGDGSSRKIASIAS